MKASSIIQRTYPIVLSVLVLCFLIKTLHIKNIGSITAYVTVPVLLTASIFYFFVKVINTFRYKIFYKLPNFNLTLTILFLCNCLLNLLPFRAGEVSYVRYFYKYFRVDYYQGASRLIIIRIFDYLSVFLLVLTSVFFAGTDFLKKSINGRNFFDYSFYVLLIIGIFVVSAGLVFFLFKKRLYGYVKKIRDPIQKILLQVVSIRKSELVTLMLLSLSYWFARIFLGFTIFFMLGIKPGFFVFILISMTMALMDILPFKTFAGFGIFEGGYIALLGLLGYGGETVFNKIVAIHLVLLFPVILFGLLAYIVLFLIYKHHPTSCGVN